VGIDQTIRSAADKVLKSADGFVVFDDGNELEYVQFSRERDGLMMMWPTDGPRVPAGEDVQSLLESVGFTRGDDIRTIPAKTFVVEDDGIYAQFGTDVDLIENFTTAAFERVYGRLGLQKINARVDV
jgi:hypothetical protein